MQRKHEQLQRMKPKPTCIKVTEAPLAETSKANAQLAEARQTETAAHRNFLWFPLSMSDAMELHAAEAHISLADDLEQDAEADALVLIEEEENEESMMPVPLTPRQFRWRECSGVDDRAVGAQRIVWRSQPGRWAQEVRSASGAESTYLTANIDVLTGAVAAREKCGSANGLATSALPSAWLPRVQKKVWDSAHSTLLSVRPCVSAK